jgi:hypothetical protein
MIALLKLSLSYEAHMLHLVKHFLVLLGSFVFLRKTRKGNLGGFRLVGQKNDNDVKIVQPLVEQVTKWSIGKLDFSLRLKHICRLESTS